MDPKQTEGQNSGPATPQGGFSFSNGAMPSGTPPTNTTTPGTLSTGANVSRTMDDLNVNDRKSATSNSPFAKHHFDKVAPGTGDILIAPSSSNIISSNPTGQKGINRGRLIQFGLIFGGIALVALVIFTVVMVVNNNKTQPDKNTNTDTTPVVTAPAEELFSEYLELFTSNAEDKNDITEVWEEYLSDYASIYAVRQALQSSSSEKSNYFENLNQKWNDFISVYNGEYSKSPELQYVPYYFYYMVSSPDLSEKNLYTLYSEYNQSSEETKKVVEEMTTNPTNNYALFIFYQRKRDLYLSIVDLMDEARNANCLTGETLFNSCDLSSLKSYGAYQEAQKQYESDIPELLSVYKYGALSIIQNLSEELFGKTNVSTRGGSQ